MSFAKITLKGGIMVSDQSMTQRMSALMADLRTLMAKDIPSPKRLEAILRLLCEQLQIPTAVFYMLHPGDVLEHYITVGREIKLPNFIRTGEEFLGHIALEKKPQQNFLQSTSRKMALGIPVVRGSELIGVLALFSRKKEPFSDEVIEAVQNVAMVIAEFLTHSDHDNETSVFKGISLTRTLEGTELVRGFAIGEVLLHKRLEIAGSILAKHPDHEQKQLNAAYARVIHNIKSRLNRPSTPAEEKDLCETYLLLLNDTEWRSKISSAIGTGLTAQAALKKVGDEMLDKMRSISDPYLRERAHDLQDVIARLMQVLLKKPTKKHSSGNKILVADTLGAAELLDYDLKHIKGIIVEDGSQTSHLVIVARAYRIPLIGGVESATRSLEESAPVALDTVKGCVFLRPSDEILDELKAHQQALKKLEQTQLRSHDKPCITKDKIPVSLRLNLGIAGSIDKLPPSDGVGLYRTELLFMTAKSLPDAKSQTETYKRVLVLAKNKPVVFRTLDIGSDKVLPYFEPQNEENPAMGWRSIRMVLDRRALLRNQLRALLRANIGRTLYVMFPMVTTVSEFIEAKKTLEIEIKNALVRKEKIPNDIKVGTMLEVPSILFQLDHLLPLVDFVSIGTNDLAQFMFAADRTNPQMSHRYDVLSPVFLRLLKQVFDQCKAQNVDCSVCGEMASHPLEALTLLALGGRILSMSPDAIDVVKTAIRTVNLKKFETYLLPQLQSGQFSLRDALFSYLRDHHVQLGAIK